MDIYYMLEDIFVELVLHQFKPHPHQQFFFFSYQLYAL